MRWRFWRQRAWVSPAPKDGDNWFPLIIVSKRVQRRFFHLYYLAMQPSLSFFGFQKKKKREHVFVMFKIAQASVYMGFGPWLILWASAKMFISLKVSCLACHILWSTLFDLQYKMKSSKFSYFRCYLRFQSLLSKVFATFSITTEEITLRTQFNL